MTPRFSTCSIGASRPTAFLLAAALLFVGCGDEAPQPIPDTADPAREAPADPVERGGTDSLDDRTADPEDDGTEDPDFVDPDPTDVDDAGAVDRRGDADVGVGAWTRGRAAGGPDAAPANQQPTVTSVRTARQDGFDRFVLEFDPSGGLPGFEVEYIDEPVRACGSGDPVELPGQGWLSIHLIGARAHDDAGRVTVTPREGAPRLPTILAHAITCDFEGQVEWVLAVDAPNEFRLLDLREPYRLVVDVRH